MRKKITLLLFMSIVALCSYGSENLTLSWTAWNSGEPASPTSSFSDNTISFNGVWGGGAFYLTKDVSAFDYLVVTLSSVTNDGVKFYISAWDGSTYKSGSSDEEWVSGKEYIATPSNLSVAINLNEGTTKDYKANFRALSAQNTYEGTNACTIASIQFMTTAEYTYNFRLSSLGLGDGDLGTGWKGESDSNGPSYSDKVITWGDGTYQGKGWYFGTADYSDYDKVVIDFGAKTPCGGSATVEYAETGQSSAKSFEVGTTSVCIPLNATYKNSVKQIYLQNATANTKFTLKRAYAATTNYFILDEKVTSTISAVNDSYVELNRTFKVGWNTICLPFALSSGDITTYFGSGAKLYEYTSATNDAITVTEVSSLTAGTPYFLKLESAISEPITFTNVDVTATSAGNSEEHNGLTFTGNFVAGASTSGKYVLSNGELLSGGSTSTAKAFSAYLSGTKPSGARSLSIETGNGTTGLNDINVVEDKSDVYNLMGMKTDAFHKGIYIKNGKKFIVK